jgi:serine protease AprX
MSASASGGNDESTQHRVHASVILRAKSGKSAHQAGTPITPQNVKSYLPDDHTRHNAVAELQKLGFDVDHVAPTHLSISGDASLFEQVFGAKLAAKSHPGFSGQRPEAYHVYFEADRPLSVPGPLSRLIDAIELAKPAAFFVSPTPPKVRYPHISVPDDVATAMDATAAHKMGVTGAGITLAMVDSGFMTPFHPYYRARDYDIRPLESYPGDNSPGDDDIGHGTGASACALAVAPRVRLTMYKAISDSSSLTAAFSRAALAKPDIISNSWGIMDGFGNPQESTALRLAINHAVADGIVVLFATGNNEGPVSWPASEPAVISVGGVFWSGGGRVTASSFCRSGTNYINKNRECPDVCGLSGMAPQGVYIALPTQPASRIDQSYAGKTFPNGDETPPDDGWVVASGTSVATPMVAGVCALLMQHDPDLRGRPGSVRDALERSCLDVVCGSSASCLLAGPGRDDATGFGLAQAYNAILAMDARKRVRGKRNGGLRRGRPPVERRRRERSRTFRTLKTSQEVWQMLVSWGLEAHTPPEAQIRC